MEIQLLTKITELLFPDRKAESTSIKILMKTKTEKLTQNSCQYDLVCRSIQAFSCCKTKRPSKDSAFWPIKKENTSCCYGVSISNTNNPEKINKNWVKKN